MLCLGIDSGTQSTKTLVLDIEKGKVLALAQSTYGTIEGLPPGHVEQDPATGSKRRRRRWRNASKKSATVGTKLKRSG